MTNGQTWQIVGGNALFGWVLLALFLYWFFRHFLLALTFMDLLLSWLRQFRWFPGQGRRMRTLYHWLIAMGIFLGAFIIGGWQGWIDVVPAPPR